MSDATGIREQRSASIVAAALPVAGIFSHTGEFLKDSVFDNYPSYFDVKMAFASSLPLLKDICYFIVVTVSFQGAVELYMFVLTNYFFGNIVGICCLT